MMLLSSTRDHNDPELKDLFANGLAAKVRRLDELHQDNGDDATYVWMIWLEDPDDTYEFIEQFKKNIDGKTVGRFYHLMDGLLCFVEEVT
jgi:hypothetical protein